MLFGPVGRVHVMNGFGTFSLSISGGQHNVIADVGAQAFQHKKWRTIIKRKIKVMSETE